MDIQKQKRFKLIAQLGIGAAIALAIAPFIFMLIGGIVGLAVAAIIGGVLMALMPAASTWLTNLKFKALKAVVEDDPVTTLIAREQERAEALEDARIQLEQQTAGVEVFRTRASQIVKEYPEEEPALKQRLQEYEQVLAYRIDEFKESRKTFQEFQRTVAKFKAMYELAKLDEATGKSLNTGSDMLAKFKEQVAFDAIDQANAQSIARLRMSLVDDDFARQQIQGREVRTINYSDDGRVLLGNILKPIDERVPA